ncbi:MAG: hypothetical protein IPN13_19125 [Bacteroidetes bacterium]|nr:hypothetical protein [Bacteroidota bacterium]
MDSGIRSEYANTRHNIGFDILDLLVKNAEAFSSQRYGDVAQF